MIDPVPFEPDFSHLADVLERKKPRRTALFEYFMNESLYRAFARIEPDERIDDLEILIRAFCNAGYDYVLLPTWNMEGLRFWREPPLVFPTRAFQTLASRSLNAAALIFDRGSYRTYPWPDPDTDDYSLYRTAAKRLPRGMKLVISGTAGVLETAVDLVGYDRLCYLIHDDAGLVRDIFEQIGSRIVRYYEICSTLPRVGALLGNDDWGFKTQTLFPPDFLRSTVFPWHRRIVDTAHRAGQYAILHSCGNLDAVMEDVIEEMGYDGKHSFEDTICPVERAYRQWGKRIAILGGIDVDFLSLKKPGQIYRRSRAMLDLSRAGGGYALGSGNSIPGYIPLRNYVAMIKAARGQEMDWSDIEAAAPE